MKMTNWQITKEKIKGWGILTVDDVPKNIMDFLHNNISDTPNNASLAGQIKEEYKYEKWPDFVDDFILKQTNHPICSQWTDKNNVLSSNKHFYLKSLWINLQKKYEFNPIHYHGGLFSFIIFLKIPYNLEDEDKVFPPRTENETGISSCSRLAFLMRNYMGDIFPLELDVDKSFEGQMVMFPSKLQHLVYPFYTSDDYRITVSGNINFWVENA